MRWQECGKNIQHCFGTQPLKRQLCLDGVILSVIISALHLIVRTIKRGNFY